MHIQPEIIWILRKGFGKFPVWSYDGVKELQRFFLVHRVRERQVLAGRLQHEGTACGVLPVGVYQNHGLGTKGVVEILVQTGARIELPQIVGKSIAIRIDVEIVKVPIEDGSAIVDLP